MIILISAANADVCLSMARIIKAHDSYKNCRVVGMVPDIPWPARQYFDEVLTVPMANDPAYEQALCDIVKKIKPDILIPFSEAELSWFVAHPAVLKKLDTKILMNSLQILEVFLDKAKTATFLKSIGVSVPQTYELSEKMGNQLPIIIKPRCSAGSKNMAVIRNRAQLDGFLEEHHADRGRFVAQELIDVTDSEFTCGVWRFSETLRHCTFHRRLQGGMTGFARVEQHDAIDHTLEKIAASLSGDFFINVQLRMREGVPYVFEINPRFSSTVMMRHKIGFQDFIWTLDAATGKSLPPSWQPPIGTTIFRTSDECIVSGKGSMI